MKEIWEKHVKPRAEVNPEHLSYYFCFDSTDPDVISVFQLYASEEAMRTFLAADWYPEYLREVGTVIADAPVISPAELVWRK